MEQKSKRGGRREGAGRPKGQRDFPISIRISEESKKKLDHVDNKSEFIDNLILKSEPLD